MLPNEVKYLLPVYTRGRGLEIGCGEKKTFAHFIGVENGHRGRGDADVIAHYGNLDIFADKSMPYVVVDNVLTGMADQEAALKEWSRLVAEDGFLIVFCHGSSTEKVPSCDNLIYMPEFTLVQCKKWYHDEEGNGWLVILKRGATAFHTDKTACVVRLGGFGDMLQTAAILPRLQEQGYHVTVMTTPRGKDIIEHDPNVDAWALIDNEQIPNAELGEFFRVQSGEYDRFINLCESVEGTFLAMHGRAQMGWSQEARHFMMDRNYMDFAGALAGVKVKPCQLFYPTEAETKDAQARVEGVPFTVLWALSGSSLHKFYPHMDAVIARMLIDIPDIRIFFTGDAACQILETAWRNEPRIVCLSGEISIRDTLALAQVCSVVVGPETGVLNAVAYDRNVYKVIMLSHSSHENLTKHWLKTEVLTPEGCHCYPCHKLITDRKQHGCPVVESSGASLCADKIPPTAVWKAIEKAWRKHKPWSWR